ncbi:chaperonin 10-like protein [Corynascus novoguineensis]|uniref:Chaperonin 10-like protein n=1 Tax=Corynascus novoguineensis TaxID=1126955 RepID=A0AAN7CT88_9PEZI|nr:chaperonin 10-like protein [Corynascus novoguineensis]
MSQQALVLSELGTPLILRSRPIPKPKENQILLKIIAVGLNPHDQKIRDHGLIIKPDYLPYITGNDLAGVVEDVGPGVTAFKPGDRVFAQSQQSHTNEPDEGGLQQYALVPADLAAPVPPSLSLDDAATLPTAAMAAFVALFDPEGLGLPAPYDDLEKRKSFNYGQRSLLVIGGGSNCGRLAIQFARLAGFGTIVALAGKAAPEKEAELKALGATHVVDRNAPDAAEQCRAIAGGDGFLYALDTVNFGPRAHTLSVSLLSGREKGTLATLLPSSGGVDESAVPEGTKAVGYNVRFSRGSGYLHRELGQQFWRHFPAWLEAGEVRPLRYRVISGLDEKAVNETLDAYRNGGSITKTNVHPNESSASF